MRAQSDNWIELSFPEFYTNNLLCPLTLDSNRYKISGNPTNSTTPINGASYIEFIGPKRIIKINNFHSKLEDFILKFYLHVELPLIDDANDLLIPYYKYVSVEYNIQLVCKDERMKYSPIPVDLIYQRISNDDTDIIQSLTSVTPKTDNYILKPLGNSIWSQFETTVKYCPVYTYNLYLD